MCDMIISKGIIEIKQYNIYKWLVLDIYLLDNHWCYVYIISLANNLTLFRLNTEISLLVDAQ